MKCRRNAGKILLVDNEEQIRSILSQLLVKQGYSVIQAVDGFDALEKFKHNMQEITLVISDIIMPRMDGISSCKIMISISPSLKVIFISGCAPEQPLPDGVSVLIKPFSHFEILEKIRSLLADQTQS